MKLGIAYSTKDQLDLTVQTLPKPCADYDLWWCDGSTRSRAITYAVDHGRDFRAIYTNVRGGADAAIAWKLTALLNAPEQYTHIGLWENDVLLDPDWLAPTLNLFEEGTLNGIEVGAVSPRSYVDRVLIQRDGFAVMHNIGAGIIVFTREAAQHVLKTFRTAWWPTNRLLWGQLTGIDVAAFACFRGDDQFVTTDWQFETQLASIGLASLALTPSRCDMIGQDPPLKEQGLELTREPVEARDNRFAFEQYRGRLQMLRAGWRSDLPGTIHRSNGGMTFFAHQMKALPGTAWSGETRLRWWQGFGPFGYEATDRGAQLSVFVAGSCIFLVGGGTDGGTVTIEDMRSGFKFSPPLPGRPHGAAPLEIGVPGTPAIRELVLTMQPGAVFHGLTTADPQILDDSFSFDWTQLPEAA